MLRWLATSLSSLTSSKVIQKDREHGKFDEVSAYLNATLVVLVPPRNQDKYLRSRTIEHYRCQGTLKIFPFVKVELSRSHASGTDPRHLLPSDPGLRPLCLWPQTPLSPASDPLLMPARPVREQLCYIGLDSFLFPFSFFLFPPSCRYIR